MKLKKSIALIIALAIVATVGFAVASSNNQQKEIYTLGGMSFNAPSGFVKTSPNPNKTKEQIDLEDKTFLHFNNEKIPPNEFFMFADRPNNDFLYRLVSEVDAKIIKETGQVPVEYQNNISLLKNEKLDNMDYLFIKDKGERYLYFDLFLFVENKVYTISYNYINTSIPSAQKDATDATTPEEHEQNILNAYDEIISSLKFE